MVSLGLVAQLDSLHHLQHVVKHTNAADSPPVSSKRLATPSAKKKALTEMPISLCKVLWQSNLHWTDTLVTFLSENPETCLKLFSDSVKTAKTQGHAKVWISSPMLSVCNEPLVPHIGIDPLA